MFRSIVVSSLLILSAAIAQAVPIVGVTATTNTGTFPGADPLAKTLDFTNLNGNTLASLTDVTAISWFSDNTVLPPAVTITYALNGFFQLSQFGFWNADNNSNNVFGFRDVLIESSIDNLAYTPLTGGTFTAGTHTFAQAPLPTGNSAEIVSFNSVTASFFRFTILNSYDVSGFPGYNTIMFDATAVVPELNPSAASLPLASLSCFCLLAFGRRRSSAAV